jgi:hypothetical protein
MLLRGPDNPTTSAHQLESLPGQLIWHAIHLICYFAQPEFPKLGSLTELRQERWND